MSDNILISSVRRDELTSRDATIAEQQAEIKRLQRELEVATRILDFVRASMQMYSPKMNGQHSWRFMSHMLRHTAPTAGAALRLNADRYHNDVAERQKEKP